MVIDTSILLAIFFKEKHSDWAMAEMQKNLSALRMSTVNLTETFIQLLDKQPQLFNKIQNELMHSGIRFVAPDILQSTIAANARIRFPLNLGDCFAYALAHTEGCGILTLDQDFRVLDVPVFHP